MINQRCENVIYVNYQFQRLENIVIQILWRHSDSFIATKLVKQHLKL